ncbi:MAG: hypothetical protein WBR18_00175 [Anaerolineales bacterium]
MRRFRGLSPAVRQAAGPAVFFVFLSVLVTWPLVLHLGDRVPGWYIADNYEYLWKMWWFKRSLVDLHTSPLFVPNILYPSGFSLAFAELTPLHTLIGLPLTILFGEIATYNLFCLASFVVSGWATYELVSRWTKSPLAGLFAGVVFVLNPYHVVRYGGILPLMAVEGIPLFLLGIEGWFSSRRLRWILLAALGFLVSAWASIYYLFGLVLLGPLYIAVRFATGSSDAKDRKTLVHLAGLLGLCIAMVVPLALPYLALRNRVKMEIPLQDTDYWSASPTDYLLPSGIHPLWGGWVSQNELGVPPEYPQIALEFVLGTGYVCLLFAVYGVAKTRRGAKWALVGLTGAAFVLSLGPTLHIGRHPLVIPAPATWVASFNHLMDNLGGALPAHETYDMQSPIGLTIPLPALFLRWLIQPLTGMRAWNRFAAFFSLGLSLLAGLGFAAWVNTELASGSPRRKILLPLAFIGLAVFELWPRPIPLQPIQGRPVDGWLAAEPDGGAIMELPLNSALSAPQMLYTRYHGKPIVFAYGTFLPYWYRSQYPEFQSCPEQACLDRLRSWGVGSVLLNRSDPSGGPALEAKLDASPSLDRVATVGDHVVYRLLP